MNQEYILVIEDEEHISSLLREIIKLHGAKALIAESEEDALAFLAEHSIVLAIVDLTLPDANGLVIAQNICAKYPYLSGKVLFTSGYEPEDDLLTHLEQSEDRFIAKPFHLTDIRQELTEMMG